MIRSSRNWLVMIAIATSAFASVAHADEDDMAMMFLKCFHPTGKYDRVKMDPPHPVGPHAGVDGRIFFRGGFTGSTYFMRFLWEYRTVEGRYEIKVTPGEDTAPFVPNPSCRLRNWVDGGRQAGDGR